MFTVFFLFLITAKNNIFKWSFINIPSIILAKRIDSNWNCLSLEDKTKLKEIILLKNISQMYSYLFLSTSSCVSCHWLLINFLWIVSLTFFMRTWLLDLTADQILINSWLKDSQSDSGELWVQMSLGFPKEYPEAARDKGSSLFIRLSPAVKISQKSKLKAKNVNASVDFLGWSLRRFLVCTVRGWYNCSYYKDSNCVPFFFFLSS